MSKLETSNQQQLGELESRVYELEETSKAVLVAVWRAIQAGQIPERGPVADTVLNLRDALNPGWPDNSDWLPEELRT